MNIIWQHTETHQLKITHVVDPALDVETYAESLKETDAQFEQYEAVLFNAELPEARFWREAWACNTAAIEIDMAAAKNVFKQSLRAARKPKLDALDVQYMRALENGDTALMDSIADQKQALRDLTSNQSITLAETVEDLEAAWPEILGTASFT